MKYKIAISAPYMYREKSKIEIMVKEYPFEIDWISVTERLEEEELLPIIDKYDGIICGDDRITSRVIDAGENLKAIVKWGTGVDSIDIPYAESKGIAVCRTPNAFTEPVADTTLGLMLNEVRGIRRNDAIVKNGGWDKPQGYTLREKVVGIIGFGDIGQAVAKRLIPFGSKVLVNDIKELSPELLTSLQVTQATKEEIYATCDIITLHTDLNPTSRYLLNTEVFGMVQKKPYIINTARGPLVEEKALLVALECGVISGVGLDVFEIEPLPLDNPLRSLDTVTGSCHNTNSSPLCWDKVHTNSLKMMLEALTK
jgi:phosphoglycerate dehydrogenase-like enzyme